MGIRGKRILIVGGTGSLGQALIRRMSNENELIIASRDEAKHWTLRNRLSGDQNATFVVADIRDKSRMEQILRETQPQMVLLAAALKQVDTCEMSPYESVQTNILGISNMISSITSLENELQSLESVLMISTDKACAPTNVYGMSKAISERIVTSAKSRENRVKFIGVRYGNVLESRGSIIPLFKNQIHNKSKLTVTHEEMTRFVMTLDESIDLIEYALQNAASGEIWLPKLKSMKIIDLARIFVDKFGSSIEITGVRPGEKLHEELISETESIRIREGKRYFKLLPSFANISREYKLFSYSSRDCLMGQNELRDYLDNLKILEKDLSSFPGREIEENLPPKS